MTQRFLAGFHPGFGTMGVWLSQAGVDVTQAGPAANFILRPDVKYWQIIMSGFVAVGSGQQVDIAMPADMVRHPYVWVKGNIDPAQEYPCNVNAAGGTGSNPAEINFSAFIWRDKISIYNPNEQYSLYGTYMVFNRSLGG
jgi:hypothetical protein